MSRFLSAETITVRSAAEPDAAEIARLAAELGYPVSADTMRRRVRTIRASPSDLLVVAIHPTGETVGWLQAHSCHVIESGFRVEILGLIVSRTARRSGVGRVLAAAAEQWATSIHAEFIVVRSNVQRVESHAFYAALGFNTTKTQHVYRKTLPIVSIP